MAIFNEEAGRWFRALKTDCLSVVLYIFAFLLWLTPLVLFHPIAKLATRRFLIILYFCMQNNLCSILFLIFGVQHSAMCQLILRKSISECNKQCIGECVFRYLFKIECFKIKWKIHLCLTWVICKLLCEYFIKNFVFNFLVTNFLVPKSTQQCQNWPLLPFRSILSAFLSTRLSLKICVLLKVVLSIYWVAILKKLQPQKCRI